MLITLYLVNHGLLNKPSLYLSAHLDKHRGAYYDALTRVRESHDIGHWVRFFLQAVVETAENGKKTFQRILHLRQEIDAQIVTLGRRTENAHKLLLHLYQKPALNVNQAAELLGIKYTAANQLISALVDLGVLREETGWQRNRIFVFGKYLDVFHDKNDS